MIDTLRRFFFSFFFFFTKKEMYRYIYMYNGNKNQAPSLSFVLFFIELVLTISSPVTSSFLLFAMRR